MRLPFLLLALPLCALAADQATVVEATWDRFSQHTDLRYTHLGTQSRIEPTAADKPAPYLLIDTAQDQRITVYRHNSSWRCDPVTAKPCVDSTEAGLPAMPQPPPGIGPQGPIGPRTGPGAGPAAVPPTPGYGSPIPQSAISKILPQGERDPQSPAPGAIGPQGPIGPRTGPGAATPDQPAMPALPALPERPALPQMPAAPASGYGAGASMPTMPAGIGPQSGVGPGVDATMPGPGMGAGFGGGMPMPPSSAMAGHEQAPTLTKTEETQTLLGHTAVKYTITGRMMETVEIWAVPDADFGAFFAYRPQPPHRFGPRDLEEEWDALLRREHLFPLLAVFKQGDREVARFTVARIDQRTVEDPETFFAPPAQFYRCPPDPF